MTRVTKIISIDNFSITCLLNNGAIKSIDMEPLLQNHKHLKGIEKLYNQNIFNQAKIGMLGEIFWEKIITTEHNGEINIWDYDVSPELIMTEGKENKVLVTSE
jgi:hypothetical protein